LDTEEAHRVGARVRVREHHRIAERRGLVGRIVGRYGGEKHVAIDVRLSDGERRLFWPNDLEELSFSRSFVWPAPFGSGAKWAGRATSSPSSSTTWESDPDVAVLKRQDGVFVAAFSARGATSEGIVEAAREDYWRLMEEPARKQDRRVG
jgi:hypothetical protein